MTSSVKMLKPPKPEKPTPQASPTVTKATKQAAANRSRVASPNNLSQPPTAVTHPCPPDSPVQNTDSQPLAPPHLSPAGAETSVFFPGLCPLKGCSSRKRHNIEDGGAMYFSTFSSFLDNSLTSVVMLAIEREVETVLSRGSVPEQGRELAVRVEANRLYFHLARLQVLYAMGVMVDRLNCMEASEIVAHNAAHKKPAVGKVYEELLLKTRRSLYQNVECAAEKFLDNDLALLTSFDVDFASIKSENMFGHMEQVANRHFDNPLELQLLSA
ncbi:hypothetical protein BKA70DRAFT_1219446 [Coprinopsis sp. MPI-PUGE-AT-0042]|nr:hypothetical protein BKA70DRAFT_1219446 [Coprinopsis sp. MPI-PUGE-AT-0042]